MWAAVRNQALSDEALDGRGIIFSEKQLQWLESELEALERWEVSLEAAETVGRFLMVPARISGLAHRAADLAVFFELDHAVEAVVEVLGEPRVLFDDRVIEDPKEPALSLVGREVAFEDAGGDPARRSEEGLREEFGVTGQASQQVVFVEPGPDNEEERDRPHGDDAEEGGEAFLGRFAHAYSSRGS